MKYTVFNWVNTRNLVDNFPKKCNKCGSKNLKVVPNDRLDDFLPSAKPYPPPDSVSSWETTNIPVIKVVGAPDPVFDWLDSLRPGN